MSELKLTGKIQTIAPTESFDSGAQKVTFVIANNGGYNDSEQIFAFEMYAGASKLEKIENFRKYNKVGDEVDVSFNVKSREYNGKYYTNLEAWKVWGLDKGSKSDKPKDDPILSEEPPF